MLLLAQVCLLVISIVRSRKFLKFTNVAQSSLDSRNPVQSFTSPLEGNDSTTTPYRNLFALLIGINTYSSHAVSNLAGAVADLDAMLTYLTETLGVPVGNITSLVDSEATGYNIIEHIRYLGRNPMIARNSPILIYFAGHGSTFQFLEGHYQGTGSHDIEMLLPYDFDTPDHLSRTIWGIPDYGLGELLSELEVQKGNNVVGVRPQFGYLTSLTTVLLKTVVLDCCNSGSGTRAGPGRTSGPPAVRGITTRSISRNDNTIYQHFPPLPSTGSPSHRMRSSMASHVLLAACGKRQEAHESFNFGRKRGAFTEALLSVLKGKDFDTRNTSYERVIELISLKGSFRPRLVSLPYIFTS